MDQENNKIDDIIREKEEIQRNILCFIEEDDDKCLGYFKNPNNFKKHNQIKEILFLISKIANNHVRTPQFFTKIEKILLLIKSQITDMLSNAEIFDIFKNNKRSLLTLFKNKILIPNKSIAEVFFQGKYRTRKYPNYFLPEIKQTTYSKKEILAIEKENKKYCRSTQIFEENRQKGENHDIFSQMIRYDRIEEFVEFVNKSNILLSTCIKPSIFETNSFLLKSGENISLIQYAAFCGSIQIFQYLCINKVALTPSLWPFAFHSNNGEIIELLKEHQVKLPTPILNQLFICTIKCHHLDTTSYLLDNFFNENDASFDSNYSYSVKYLNYAYFPKHLLNNSNLYYMFKYDLCDIIECFFEEIKNYNFQAHVKNQKSLYNIAIERNNVDIIYILWKMKNYVQDSAFYQCKILKRIDMPESVKSIGNYAFSGCTSLEKVLFNPVLESIGSHAFEGCKALTEITIPSLVKSISDFAFEGCSMLQKVVFHSSLITAIRNNTFSDCSSLTQIAIPASVTVIEDYAFSGCSSLTEITIPSSVPSIGHYAFIECSSLKHIAMPSSVTSIGDYVFTGCTSLEEIIISPQIAEIGYYMFSECSSLSKIVIPPSVTSIKESAFSGCSSLKDITISPFVTCIEDSSFSDCSLLKEITIPSTVTSFGYSVFNGCISLSKMTFNFPMESIHESTLCNCSSLEHFEIPSYVTKIECNAFIGCSSLKKITIPPSVTSIDDYAFSGCSSLKQIEIPSSVSLIGSYAFDGCSSLIEVTIPSSVTSIEPFTFNECTSLKKIEIPSSVTSIKMFAFSKCTSFVKFTVPSSITSIGESVFNECSSLSQVTILASIDKLENCTFKDCTELK